MNYLEPTITPHNYSFYSLDFWVLELFQAIVVLAFIIKLL